MVLRRVAVGIATLIGVVSLALSLTFAGGANAHSGNPGAGYSFAKACGPAAAGFARCHAIQRLGAHPNKRPTPTPTTPGGPTPTPTPIPPTPTPTPIGGGGINCSTNPGGGYTPCDLQSAYSLTTASANNGTGLTVAIVDAFDDPNAESDLGVYRSQWNLSPCTTANGCFKKVNQTGGTSYPRADSGWAQEISLDVDMVSAICPNCHILLVEATTNSFSNLAAAVNEAAALGANAISNSYGGGEFSSETSDTAFNHPGIAITASSGDSGFGAQYPAASPYVTAVGGTTLNHSGSTWSETVWSGAGSGCSAYEPQQSWQTSVAAITAVCGKRAIADVSAVADPATGVDVYDTYGTGTGWLVFGGTSVASPIIASVYALAGNTGTVNYGSFSYSHTGSLHDVTSGSNGSCGNVLCNAQPGWDGPTGNGTPNGTGGF